MNRPPMKNPLHMNHAPLAVPPLGGRHSLIRLKLFLGLSSLALTLAGCQSGSPAPYIAPRVTGRVLDARTSQPLAGVAVSRLTPDQNPDPSNPPHGGQLIEQVPVVRTGPDGSFVLDSVRDFTPFRRSGWYGVSIAFEHRDYVRRVIDYTLANATNSAKGEPVVPAGDIRLEPKTK
jgi:hypothetical protein